MIRLYNKFEKEINSLNQKEKDLNKRIKKAKNIYKIVEIMTSRYSKYKENFEKNADKIKYFLNQGPLNGEEYLLIKEYIQSMGERNKNLLDINLKTTTITKKVEKYVNETKKLEKSKDKKAFEKQS